MGNRAVITTEDKQLGVYLHWNGGRNSVEALLLYCKLKGYRAPETDCYGWARLCQVIGNFFGGIYSVGIDRYDRLDTDNGDNGTYIIKNWQIVDKEFEPLDTLDVDTVRDIIMEINANQPASEQFDKDTLLREFDNYFKTPITKKQIVAIHTIACKLGMGDNYKPFLQITFGVDTCKDLTEKQASVLIDILKKLEEV